MAFLVPADSTSPNFTGENKGALPPMTWELWC